MDTLVSRLEWLGFKYEEFPDGWFWHLSPKTVGGKIRLAKALGLEDVVKNGPPDTVVLRANKDGSDWDYFFGDEGGDRELLVDYVAMCVLDALEDDD